MTSKVKSNPKPSATVESTPVFEAPSVFDPETGLRFPIVTDQANVDLVDMGHEPKAAVAALKAIAALASDFCCCIGMHDPSNSRCAVTIARKALE